MTVDCSGLDFKGLELAEDNNSWDNGNSGWDSVTERRSCDKRVTNLERLFAFKQGIKLSIDIHHGGTLKGNSLEAQAWMFSQSFSQSFSQHCAILRLRDTIFD